MSQKRHKKTPRVKSLPPLWGAVLVLVVGLFLGTVMTFGQHYWRQSIPQEDAVRFTAAYDSFFEQPSGRYSAFGPVILRFSDHEQVTVDVECVTPSLRSCLEELHPGDHLEVWCHPHSNTVLALSVEGEPLLDYQAAQATLQKGNIGFLIFGILLYLAAACAVIWLIALVKQRKAIRQQRRRF